MGIKNAETTLRRQYKRQNDFNKNNYDRVGLMLPKGTKEKIKAAAGDKSVNAFILELINRELESIGAGSAPEEAASLPWDNIEDL